MKKRTLVIAILGAAIAMTHVGNAWAWGSVISSGSAIGHQTPIMTNKPDTGMDPTFSTNPVKFVPAPTTGSITITPGITTGPSSGSSTDDGVNESVPSGDIGVVAPPPTVDDAPPAGEETNDANATDPKGNNEGEGSKDIFTTPEGKTSVENGNVNVEEKVTEAQGDVVNTPESGADEVVVAPTSYMVQGGGCSLVRPEFIHSQNSTDRGN